MKRSVKKVPGNPVEIMVFGTFEIIHPGHLDFFRQARALAKNPRLIVSVSRDLNAGRIKRRKPAHNEIFRLRQVRKISGVDKAMLGGKEEYFSHIRRQSPDIIALGYDQKAYVASLLKDLKKTGMTTRIVRLKPYKSNVYKTSFIRRNMVKSNHI